MVWLTTTMGADDHEAVHDSARAVGSLAERNHWFSHRANDCTVRPIGVSRQTSVLGGERAAGEGGSGDDRLGRVGLAP
jgi:hypothetical protein